MAMILHLLSNFSIHLDLQADVLDGVQPNLNSQSTVKLTINHLHVTATNVQPAEFGRIDFG